MKEEIYQKIRDHSYNLAYFMTKDHNDAEDITQIVSLKFLKNEDNVENPIAWSRTVTKREVYNRSKQLKKSEILVESNQLEKYEDTLEEFLDEINETEMKMEMEEIKELLNKEDFRIYKHMKSCDFNINLMAKKLKLSRDAAFTRAYKVRRNLKAKKLLKEGYTTSRDIIGYNTNKNIVKFIKYFVKKMKENDLSSLHSYLKNIDKNEIECLHVNKVFDYEIRLLNCTEYELLLPYKNKENKVNFCILRFYVDNKKKIKVSKFKSKPRKVIESKISPEEFKKRLPKIEKGIMQSSRQKMKEILEID